jgi:hypothetical protein
LSGEEKLGGGQIADVVPRTRRVEIEQKLSVFSYVAIDYRAGRGASPEGCEEVPYGVSREK